MDSLSDDVFHHILSFIPTCKELSRMSVTCSRAFSYIHQSNRTDPLFRQLWFQQYQTKGSRRHYQSNYNLQQLLQYNTKSSCPINTSSNSRSTATTSSNNEKQPRSRKAGLLSSAQEHAALLYDNGIIDSNTNGGGAVCNGGMGYFGMQQLWDYGGPVAIWGDFFGVRIFSGGTKGTLQDRERTVVSIGEDESHVLCVQAVPDKKLIFLGFASGKVVCIQAVWVDKHQYTYQCISSATKHTNEVTSLCLIEGTSELLSASVDGTVVKYPLATSAEKTLDSAMTIVQVGNPVLTMATIEHRGRTFLLTGDQGAHVSLWWKISDQEWRHSYARLDGQGVPTQSTLWLDGSDLYVIVGGNDGRILTWRLDDHLELEWMGDSSEEFICNKKTSSPVESFSVEGNLLLVGAGRHTAAFELPNVVHSTPKFTGSLVCHPNPQRYASVVSCYLDHDRQSCVTLCRDGTLHEWSYRREEIIVCKKEKREQQQAANKRKREKAAAATLERKMARDVKAEQAPKQRKGKNEEPKRRKVKEVDEEYADKRAATECAAGSLSLRPHKTKLAYIEEEDEDAILDMSQLESVSNENEDSSIAGVPPLEQLEMDAGEQQGKESICALGRFMQSQEGDKNDDDDIFTDTHGVATKAVNALPMTPLDKFMNTASEKEGKAMRMRIIQAGVQHFKLQMHTFLGVDKVTYGKIPDAFEKHSGFSPCSKCHASYDCRVKLFHTKGMDFEKSQHAEKLLKSLMKAKSLNHFAIPCINGHVCDRCYTTLKVDRHRCYICYRWKDGKRVVSPKISSEMITQLAVVTPAGSPEHEDDFKVVKSKALESPTKVTNLLAAVIPSKIALAPSLDATDTETTSTIVSAASTGFDTVLIGTHHSANEHEEVIVLPFDVDQSKLAGRVEKMWSCLKCSHFNSNRRFRCNNCKKSCGGSIYKVLVKDQAPVPKELVESTQQQPSSPIREWDCQNCGDSNAGAEYSCSGCGTNGAPPPPSTKKIFRRRTANAQKSQVLQVKSLEKKVETIWSCRKCTYSNGVGAVSCEVCHTARKRVNAVF